MRPLTILGGSTLVFVFLIGCRQEATQEDTKPSVDDPRVDRIRADLKKDNNQIPGNLNRDNNQLPVDLKSERKPADLKQVKEPIPSDFKIVAQYGAGYSDWKSWKFTITGDGVVAKEIYNSPKSGGETTTLSHKEILDLIAKIDQVGFDSLPERKSYKVTDNPTLIVTVTRNDKTQKVTVYAPRHLQEDKEVKRFLRLWAEILRKVPSPNPDDSPERWEPQSSTSGRPSGDQNAG